MDWGTLVATVSGGFIAISGTVLADHLRRRHENDREAAERRRAVYIEFISAVGDCHSRLRQIAQDQDTATDPDRAARAALSETAVHEVRERFFIDASADVAGAGQAMFAQLRAVPPARRGLPGHPLGAGGPRRARPDPHRQREHRRTRRPLPRPRATPRHRLPEAGAGLPCVR